MERKCTDPAIQLDIDEMILDYLVFSAINGIIIDYERRGELSEDADIGNKVSTLLQLVDSEQPNFGTQCPISTND